MPSPGCETSTPAFGLALADRPYSLPTRWNDAQIVVNDAVLIEPPYTIDNLKVLPGKEQSLASVRRIMDQYHQRKKNAAPARAPVATPIAPRKGG
jgi:hypothetical protein